MNNKKQVDSTPDKSGVGSTPETKVDSKAQHKTQNKTKPPATGRGWRLLTVFLLLAILVGGGALAWFGQALWRERSSTSQALAQQRGLIESLAQQVAGESSDQGRLVAAFEDKLAALRQEQQSQLALLERNGDASRGRYLLDEAEFLIRLANQRLLVERRPQGAQSLLESADQVLAKLDDPGLISLRKTLAENIAELRRTTTIDREGLFLRIGTLLDLVMTFPALPAHGLKVLDEQSVSDESVEGVESSWYLSLWHNLRQATQGFVDRHFHVRSLEQPLAPLMSLGRETQLRYNLLITLGNAQQAVLREETNIYRASLIRAKKDTARYFALNDDTRAMIEQLEGLQSEVVLQNLPDISASLYALRDYRAVADSRHRNGEG